MAVELVTQTRACDSPDVAADEDGLQVHPLTLHNHPHVAHLKRFHGQR